MNKSYEFHKKIMLNEGFETVFDYQRLFALLINCMKETNGLHNKDCELFTLTFRHSTIEDGGYSPYVLEMKWGER